MDFPAPFGPMMQRNSPRGTTDAHVVCGDHTTEVLGQAFGAQDGIGHPAFPLCKPTNAAPRRAAATRAPA